MKNQPIRLASLKPRACSGLIPSGAFYSNLKMRISRRRAYQNRSKTKGITLIELLVALVICGLVVAGIYRFFVAQSKAYIVQDQVVEVQQGIRNAMEILLRDLRMAGFDSDSLTSKISIANPIVAGDHSVTVSYEYDDTTQFTVEYRLDGNTLKRRQITTKDDGSNTDETQDLLENVEALDFTYGVDTNTGKVVTVRVVLTARPTQVNPDLKMVWPRTLESAVALRNFCMGK